MPYVTTEKMLHDAARGGYAVGAFNFENMEMALAIVAAAEKCRAPVILQTTPSTVRYASASVYRAIGHAVADAASVPVALHLDHGDSVALCREAAHTGYSSVMFDGSHSDFEENIALTRQVVDFCAAAGIPVEAELGRVGGKEDDLVSAGNAYTDPAAASEYVRRTGISSLAVAIGTAHGVYSGVPVLDVDRLSAIAARLSADGCALPLVLHGASGLGDDAMRECVRRGICKVNFATELRQAYTSAVRGALCDNAMYDPKKYGKPGMAAVSALVAGRIAVCGCAGKA